eukprot:g881.t1
MKRQRCDPLFVPNGNLDRHPELGITTISTPRQLQKRRDFKYFDGRIINKNMVSSDYPFETSGSRYKPSKQILVPSSSRVQPAKGDAYRSSTDVFFKNFGDGKHSGNGDNNNCSSIDNKTIERNGDKVNNIQHAKHHTLKYHRSKQLGIYEKVKNLAQQCSNINENSLPAGPYVRSEINGWCIPYQQRRMKSSSESNLRGISKYAPDWFHTNNTRVNNEIQSTHALRLNGRKEQAMSSLVPEFFVGERVTTQEEEYRQKNEGRGKLMKGKRRSPYMETKMLHQKQISLPKYQGKQRSPEASHKILQSNVTFSKNDTLQNENDALEDLLRFGRNNKKLACEQETRTMVDKNTNGNQNSNKSNDKYNELNYTPNRVYLRDGQVSKNKPEWMNTQWSEERPDIQRKILALPGRACDDNGARKKNMMKISSQTPKLSEERKMQLSFAGLWTLGYPNIH